jgi:hypothetical protein
MTAAARTGLPWESPLARDGVRGQADACPTTVTPRCCALTHQALIAQPTRSRWPPLHPRVERRLLRKIHPRADAPGQLPP